MSANGTSPVERAIDGIEADIGAAPARGVVVMTFEPPRFAIEIWRAWCNEWAVLEYAVDLKTAARRAELLTRKEDAPTRIIDRKPE